jgi:hypothetical protein
MKTMRTLPSATLALALALLLSGCAGTGVGERVDIEPSETYRGPVGAAVAPVVDRTPARVGTLGGPGAAQREIEMVLARSKVFAGVSSLDHIGAPNEAGALIAPTLLAADWHGTSGEVELQVRVSNTATGAVTLDKRYRGTCSGCPASGPLAAATQKLAEDLRKTYGSR